jgi:CHRD domain-containing protein
MRVKTWQLIFMVTAFFLATSFLPAQSSRGSNFRARLTGFGEVPAVSSEGRGQFRATLQPNGTEMTFELEYSGLSGPATMAHIHIGQKFASGAIVVHFCGTGGQAACPGAAGTVTGTFGASRVVDATAQGISAGEFAEVLAAIRSGNAYVNVHTAQSPQGEIRGQIRRGRGSDDDDDDDDDN